jgi:Na+/melibiose symporter-like transporter
MSKSGRHSWVRPAVLVGIAYAVVGIVFARPDTHAQAWRLAAWILSAAGYAAHIAYERLRLRSSTLSAAVHVAAAVAVGAFGLAVGANIHSLSIESTSRHRKLLLLSLGIWPVITALPAFVVALAANVVLSLVRRPGIESRS